MNMRSLAAVCTLLLVLQGQGLRTVPIYTSQDFAHLHTPTPGTYHPECPERVAVILEALVKSPDKYEILAPGMELDAASHRPTAVAAVKLAHDEEYIKDVFRRCKGGATGLSPWDTDTYLSRDTFELCLLAQSCWLDGVRRVLDFSRVGGGDEVGKFAFAVTRPPGHHAEFKSGMGFCIFNFAAGAALHAVTTGLASRVAILDFDVHYGNGVADIITRDPRIRYASLHQGGIYPNPPVPDGVQPGEHSNVLTVNLNSGFQIDAYLAALREKVLPFLSTDFGPDLLIVSAGVDALASEEIANGGLRPADFAAISKLLREAFPNVGVLYGLEGGYVLRDLPTAVEAAIEPWL